MKTTTRKISWGQKQDRLSMKKNALAATATSVILILATAGASAATLVNLGTAGNFAILSSAGISTTTGTSIVGDIGVSPIASTAVTGFSLTLDPSGQFSTSDLVTGKVFAANYSAPTPTALGVAIGDMQTAYTDAAGRSNPDFLNLLSGNLDGQTLSAGLYKWGSAVSITNSVTINGGGDSNAVWIFQIDNRLSLANGANIILTNGAQTAVTLQSNAITQAIPEPTTWAMLIMGLGAVAFVDRRRFGSNK